MAENKECPIKFDVKDCPLSEKIASLTELAHDTNLMVNKINTALCGDLEQKTEGLISKSRNFEREIEDLKKWKEEALKTMEDYRSFRQDYKRNLKMAVLILSALGTILFSIIKSIAVYYYTKITGQHP